MKRNLSLQIGTVLVAALTTAAIAGLFLDVHPASHLADSLAPPSMAHWFGCDPFGADVGKRLLLGAWQSLKIALIVTLSTLLAGLGVGTLAALAPPGIEIAIVRMIDCFLAFPGLLLAILIASIMPHSESTVIFALAATGWTGRARFCRALIKKILPEPFVEAAVASGASTSWIVRRHLWPQLFGQLAVQAAHSFGSVIVAEASLSFMGLGGGTENPSWGKLIAEGREYLVEAPHLSVLPGAAFVLTVIAFNLVAEGLRKRLDPMQDIGVY